MKKNLVPVDDPDAATRTLLLGSVAYRVVHQVQIPVTLVK
jgi:nucleotide-binding universal stress UspA family protein